MINLVLSLHNLLKVNNINFMLLILLIHISSEYCCLFEFSIENIDLLQLKQCISFQINNIPMNASQ